MRALAVRAGRDDFFCEKVVNRISAGNQFFAQFTLPLFISIIVGKARN